MVIVIEPLVGDPGERGGPHQGRSQERRELREAAWFDTASSTAGLERERDELGAGVAFGRAREGRERLPAGEAEPAPVQLLGRDGEVHLRRDRLGTGAADGSLARREIGLVAEPVDEHRERRGRLRRTISGGEPRGLESVEVDRRGHGEEEERRPSSRAQDVRIALGRAAVLS